MQRMILAICLTISSGCAGLADFATGKAQGYVDAELHKEYGLRPDDSALKKLIAVIRKEQDQKAAVKEAQAKREAELLGQLETAREAKLLAKNDAEQAVALARIAELETKLASTRADGDAQVQAAADQRNGGLAGILVAAVLAGYTMWRKGATLQEIIAGQGRAVKQYLQNGGTGDLLGLFEANLGPRLEAKAKEVLAKAGVGVKRPRPIIPEKVA